MVAIVSGNGTGLGQASLAQLGGRGNLGQSSSGKTGEKTYVNVGTGNVVVQDNDALLIGRGVDVSLIRTYNSQGKLTDDNGDAWWINGYRRITNLSGTVNTAGSQVERIGQDGSISKFVYDSTRQLYVGVQGNAEFDTLSSDGSNWTWTNTASHQSETYQGSNGTWKLASASDANGNVTKYSYNGDLLSKITNANGESVEFVYAGRNLSQERIVAADGKVTTNTHYRYDAQNRLQQVMLDLSPEDASITDGKVYATSYTYVGASNLIESITQTDGSYQKFTYVTVDGESRVSSVTDAYNNTTRFEYDTVNRQTKVTDAFGNVNIYILDANHRFDTIIAPGANGQTETLRYSYDAAGNVATITDALGHVTSFTYDAAGNLLSKTDTAGNRTENTYDAKRNLLTTTLYPVAGSHQANGAQTTRFVYDEHQQLRFQISATGMVSEQRFDANGQKIAEVHFTSASYPSTGLAASDALSLAQMQSWSTAQVQSNSTRSDYAYNTRGQLSSTTTYAKIGVDGQGIKDGTESLTRFSYDVSGNLLLSIDAQNNQTSYTYDGLNRLLSTTDALQKTSFIEYDDANRKVILHNVSGRIDTQVYDNQGHLLSSILGGELTTSYGYDALGRLVYAKDPTGVEQLHIYDAAGNLQADVNGRGEVTQYIYNKLGERVQTIARANALTDAQFQQIKSQVVHNQTAITPAMVLGALTDPGANPVPTPSIPTTPTPTPINVQAAAWSASTFYVAGSYVNYQGQIYKTRWDTLGDTMTGADLVAGAVWEPIAGTEGYSLWQANLTYHGGNPVVSNGQTVFEGGEIVGYNGHLWQAQWYHAGAIPSSANGSPWKDLGLIGATAPTVPQVPQWDAAAYYPAGSIVEYQGQQYKSRWDTMGSTMTSANLDEVKVWRALPNKDGYSNWQANITYWAGETEVVNGQNVNVAAEVVAYNGHLWQARWFHVGTTPSADSGAPWLDLGLIPSANNPVTPPAPAVPQWNANTYYPEGSVIEYQGQQYKSRWDTMGSSMTSADPLDVQVWRALPNKDGYSVWQTGITYRGGETEVVNGQTVNVAAEIVAYDGKLWQARWFHRGTTPVDDSSGPWALLGNVPASTSTPAPTPTAPLPYSGPLPTLPAAIEISIPVTASASDMIVRTLYDNLGRVAKTISPLGEITELQYNAAGKLVATIQRANTLNPSSVGINATAEEIQVTADSKDRSSYRYYDQDQKLIGTVDAEGGIVEYRYDSAGRQTVTIAYATQNKNAQVNSLLSGLITQNPSTDAVSYNFYNAENQLIGSVNAEGYATEYQYNLSGQLTQTTRYINRITNVSVTSDWNSVKPVADGADRISTKAYDKLGRMTDNFGEYANGMVRSSLHTQYFYDGNTGELLKTKTGYQNGIKDFENHTYDKFGNVINSLSSNGGQLLENTPGQATQLWKDYGVKYTYDAGNRRTSSTDQNGHRTLFYYDQAGHLTHTINALGEVKESRYNHLGQLTDTIAYGTRLTNVGSLNGGLVTSSLTQSLAAITNSQLDTVQHLSYDLDGRVVTTTDANGVTTTYSYDQFGERTSTTSLISDTENVLNKTSYNKLGQVTETIQDANGIKQTIHTDYDAFGRVIRSVDANGNITTQTFDRLGRKIEVADQASGHTNKTTYDPFDRLLTQVDAKGAVTTFGYSSSSQLVATNLISAEGVKSGKSFNGLGLVGGVSTGTVITSFVYDNDGNLLNANQIGANGILATTSNVYDKADLLKESTDANGNKTTYTYDDANRLTSKTLTIAGSAPLVTTYAYDAKGQQVEITDPNKVKTKLEYDLKGQLIKQTVDPDGLKLVTEYDYDKRGKTLKVTQKGETQDLVQRYVFDKLGRRIEEYTGTTLTRSYQYDANNNVISTTDALNKVTRFAYDSEDRQILVLDASGGMQRTIYDENGRVKSVRRYATTVNLTGLSAQPTRAALESLIPAETAQDRFSTNFYDKDGRVTSTVDALGGVVSYVYDANNNVVKKTSGDGINPANDRTQWFAYDGMNRLTVSIAADGSVMSHVYDGNGNVTSTTAYVNRISTANLAVGATSQTYLSQVRANAQQDRTERRAYDAANRLVYSVDAQGYVTKNIYEGTHLKSTTQYDLAISVSDSALAAIQAAVNTSAKDRTSAYEYDHAGHLLKTTDAMGFTESFTYNSLGQKESFTNKKGATWTYTYDAAGRLETETAPAVEVASIDIKNGAKSSSSAMFALETRFVYDAVGNLTARIEASNSAQQRRTDYTYDALGRQVVVTYPPVDVTDSSTGITITGKQLTTRVTYDALGNAVSNLDVAGKRSYKVYDQLGRVRFDIDANGYLTEYKRNAFGEVETLIRYANDKRDTSSEIAPTLAQIVPLTSAKDRQIKTQYNQLGQAAVVTESVFYGSDGTHYEYQAKVTSNTYNAFGELSSAAVGRNVYDANGALLQAGVDIATTRYAYNQRGQQVAILDAENYLTRQQFDAYGNVLLHIEFATPYAHLASSWTGSESGLPVADISLLSGASDRGVRYEYDLINRKTTETRLNVEFAQLSHVNRTDSNVRGSVKTQFGYDQLGNLVSKAEQEIDSARASSGISNIGLITRTSAITYDMLGRVATTTSSGSGTSNTAIYTVYKRDAYGNAVVTTQTEMKQGSKSGTPLMVYMGSMNAGQNLLENQALYSANGRFQLVMQTDGNLVMYDREQGNESAPGIIWQSGTRAPSGSTGFAVQTDGNLALYHAGAPLWQSATRGSGMVLRLQDDGNLVLTNASQQIVWQTATIVAAGPVSKEERTTYAQYNAFGKVTDSVDAANKRSHQSYDASGNLVAQQRKVTDINGQVVGNSDSSAMLSMEYDAAGKLIRTVELGVAGSSDTTETRYEYNAFGELQKQTVNGAVTLLNEYDNEGHLWRTTSGGITKVMLVDQEGRNTVQVTSGTIDLRSLADAKAVASHIQTDGNFTSSVTRYDHLGHVIEKQLPNVGNSNKLEVSAQSSPLSFFVNGTIDNGSASGSSGNDGRHDPNELKNGTGNVSGSSPTGSTFTGYNSLRITMPDMSSWGYGDVKISVKFQTKLGANGVPPTMGTVEKVYEALQAKGEVDFFWNNAKDWGIPTQKYVTEIVISKKDATGHWVQVNKLGATQSNSINAVINIAAPIDLNTKPVFRYRVSGNANWSIGKVTNFGSNYIFNPLDGKDANVGPIPGNTTALAEGIYEYEVDYYQNGVVVSHSSGNMTVGYGSERIKIAQLYVALLGRAPTDSELVDLTKSLANNTLDQMAQYILGRPELSTLSGEAVLNLIYKDALKREIDDAGKAYWLAQWNSGATNAHGSVVADIIRGTVAYAGDVAEIVTSSKLFNNKVSVALTYGGELKGRDIAVAAAILTQVSATDTTAALASASVGTLVTDAQARLQLTRLYVLLQNRSPEYGGFKYYADGLMGKLYNINAAAANILDQSPLAGKSNKDIADTIFDTVLNWKESSAKSGFLDKLNAATTSAQKATAILELIDDIVGNTKSDFGWRQAQQLFNNRVNVGMLYANSFSLTDDKEAATINALVTATDTLTAINAVFAKLDATQNKQLNLTRLYVMLFNRAPDPKGYKYWLQQSNLDSNISFSVIANAIWTDKFSTVSNLELVRKIYVETLGGDAASVTDSNEWVKKLNAVGQAGAAGRGEVLELMINDLVNPSGSASFSAYARQVFTLKTATGMNFVVLGGGEEKEAALALSAVEKDLKSMSASLALNQAKMASNTSNLAKLEAQAAYAATQLASAAMALEASAAALAYLKAQAASALAGYTQVNSELDTAKAALKTATEMKATADKAHSEATALANAAATAVSVAKAAAAVDNSLENQQKLTSALNELREKRSAEATAKQIKESRELDYNISVGNITQMEFMVRLKKRDWDEVADNLSRAQKSVIERQDQYDAAKRASQIALDAKDAAEREVNAATAALNSGDSAYIRQIYQYFYIILGGMPDQSAINYWINDLRRGDSPRVFAYNIYKSSDSYTRSLSPKDFFTRAYTRGLGRSDNQIYSGIDYWAPLMMNASDTPDSLGGVLANFINGVLGETSGYGKSGLDFLNLTVNKVINASVEPAQQKFKDASDRYNEAKQYESGANQNLMDAKATLARAPDSTQAKNDYDQAVRDVESAIRASGDAYRAASNAADEYRKASGLTQSAQDLVNALSAAATPPSTGTTNDLNTKLSAYNIAEGIAAETQKRANDAYDDLTLIRGAGDARLKELTQLYVLLFNRVDPQSDGLAYWVKQMNSGMSLEAVATSMYNDSRISPPLYSKTPTQLIETVYKVNLHRNDNDTLGINYWAEQLASASSSGTAKGKVFLDLIYSIQFDATSNSAALEARRFFVNAVQQGVDRAPSNAVLEYNSKTKIAGGYALDAADKYKIYSTAVTASGGAVANLPANASVKAGNIGKLLQVMFLMRNSQSMVFSDWDKISTLMRDIEQGKESLSSAAGRLYSYLGGDGQSSDALINQIYRGAMARTDYDSYQSTWVANLNAARQADNNTAKGQVFLNILDGVLGSTPGNANAFASRKYFDQNVTGLMSKFVDFQNTDIGLKMQNVTAQAGNLKTAQEEFDRASKASGTANQNTGNVMSMTTAPTVAATAQQKQVAQLYALLFNRAPEASGLDVWTKAALSNNNLATTAQQMLAGAKPEDMAPGMSDSSFLANLYANLGGTDTQRTNKHLTDLQTGVKSRGQVVAEILNEATSNQDNDIPGLNRQTLLANKAAVGLTYALTMKGDSADVARTLFAQVTADNAAAGIHAALSTSPAVYARSQVASLFIMMFGIEADLKGFDYWSERVPAVGAPLAERVAFVQNIISGDTEHRLEPYKLVDNRDFVKYIYSNAFGQLPDAAGLAHWVKQLDTQSRAEVITAILYDVQNSAGSSSIDAATQLQFRLNQKAFAEKTSLALNHLAVLEQNKLTNTGAADQQIINELRSAASVAAGLAIEADLAALQAMGDIGRKTLIQKAADISWVPTLNINNGSNGTPVAPVGHNSIIQTNDRWGNVLSATDVRDPKLQTRYHYDSDNRLIETTRVDGAKITEAYNSLGQRIGGMDANEKISFNVLDASGHVLEEHRADGNVARQDYNGFGERTSYTDATGYQTTFKYDAMGRVSSQTQLGAVKVYQSTDLTKDGGVFNPESVVPQQLSISYQYDELGRRIQTTDAAGGILRSWYDLRGNVIKADNESHTASSNGTQTTSRFDALNHKVNETDAIGGQKTWFYDIATGRLVDRTDLGGHKTLYAYNYYNQVVHEYGEGAYKKDIWTSYNQLGQVLTIQDVGTTTNTYYQYDAAGNRLTESVIQIRNTHLEVLQDNHLSYDKLGRLSQVETGRYGLKYLYDNNGNRTMVDSYYVTDIIGTDGKVVKSEEHQKITWNSYDAMNRQLVADGVNVNGVISTFSGLGHQGHEFRYDAEGRRISDTSYGKKITSTKANVFGIPVVMSGVTMGDVVETYGYDAIGRLDTVKRDGVEIDKRYYNANSQLIRSGISDSLIGQIRGDDNLKKAFQEAGVNDDFTIYKYQADKLNQVEFQQVHTTAVGLGYSGTAFHYDAAGRLERYTQDNSTTVKYDYKNKDQFDQYQVSSISGERGGAPGYTFNKYDANGHLIRVADSDDETIAGVNARNMLVDTEGRILRKELKGNNTYSLLVNGEIVGTSSKDYASDTINQSYVNQSALSSSGPSIYITQLGDTLQSVAKAVWGDATLWYLIADANGIIADQFQEGSRILIPAREVAGGNRNDTLKPYNPGEIIGNTTPNMPMPAGPDGCGMVGSIVTVAVAIILAIATKGYTSPYLKVAIAAASATAGQYAAVAAGEQDKVNWKSVALSTITAGVMPGNFSIVNDPYVNAALNGMLRNVVTQGIGIAINLQQDFSWTSLAAAGVGSAVGQRVGEEFGKAENIVGIDKDVREITQRTMVGFATGVTANLVSGGKMHAGRVLVDAFGNALGESLKAQNTSGFATRERPPITFFEPGELETYNGTSAQELLGSLPDAKVEGSTFSGASAGKEGYNFLRAMRTSRELGAVLPEISFNAAASSSGTSSIKPYLGSDDQMHSFEAGKYEVVGAMTEADSFVTADYIPYGGKGQRYFDNSGRGYVGLFDAQGALFSISTPPPGQEFSFGGTLAQTSDPVERFKLLDYSCNKWGAGCLEYNEIGAALYPEDRSYQNKVNQFNYLKNGVSDFLHFTATNAALMAVGGIALKSLPSWGVFLTGGAIGGGANVTTQMAANNPGEGIKWGDAANATITGGLTFGRGQLYSVAVNSSGTYITATLQGDDVVTKVGAEVIGTVLGDTIGKHGSLFIRNAAVSAAINYQNQAIARTLTSAYQPTKTVLPSYISEGVDVASDMLPNNSKTGKK